jgi:NTE family protein
MRTPIADLPFGTVALVLQGGGALGAYQAGAYEALDKAGLRPNWISGISIGAVNAAILAGSPPEQRIRNLRLFWETITAPIELPLEPFGCERVLFNRLSAGWTALAGLPGFFTPRFPPALARPRGSEGARSI